jgi:hypothetical protein
MVLGVEAGFVALQERELVIRGQAVKGRGGPGDLAAAAGVLHGLLEQFGLDGPRAAEAPGGGGEFFDPDVLEGADGGEALEQGVAVGHEVFGTLGAYEDLFGAQAVADGVAGTAGLAFGSFGAGGFGGVGSVGTETLVGDMQHGKKTLKVVVGMGGRENLPFRLQILAPRQAGIRLS